MEPPDRKKQILIALAKAAVPLVVMGFFFWPILKDLFYARSKGNSGSNTPLLIVGGFILVVILIVVANAISAARRAANPPPATASASSGKGGRVFMVLFSLPFAGFGVFALVQAFRKLVEGNLKDAGFLALFGLIFSGVGFGLMAATIWGGKKQKAEAAVQSRNPDKPWLWRDDWAAGKIKSATGAQTKVFAVMALAFCGIGGVSTFALLPKELHHGNYQALLVLLFPLFGLGFIIAIIRGMLVRRRFGDCYFELAQIPAPLGGTLDGMIQTGTRIRLEHGLHLKLSCIRRVVTGSGKNRNVQENILWQNEKVFRPEADLPEPEPGHSGIPVFFKLPADQPECSGSGDNAVLWRLEAKAKMSGPSFTATFEVPVFQVAGGVATEAADEPDPTVALQESVEDIRREEGSKIEVTDGPRGREFYFPAARNLGTAIGLTVFFLIWSGIFCALLHSSAPVLFPIVWGVTDALLCWGCFNLWFKSSRVIIDSTGVTAVKRWLIFSRTRRFDAADIVRFDIKAGMTSGSQVFQDLKLITKDAADSFAADKDEYQRTGRMPAARFRITSPDGFTLAGSLASKPEADWLVQEMTKSLGRTA